MAIINYPNYIGSNIHLQGETINSMGQTEKFWRLVSCNELVAMSMEYFFLLNPECNHCLQNFFAFFVFER